jgi:hypothetical protein
MKLRGESWSDRGEESQVEETLRSDLWEFVLRRHLFDGGSAFGPAARIVEGKPDTESAISAKEDKMRF